MGTNYSGALVLALLAKADETGKILQKVLVDLEQEYVKARDFEGFVELFANARTLVDDPMLVAILSLAELNGLRRIPNVDPNQVFTLADAIDQMLDALPPESERVQALRASFGYNLGIFSRDVGEFERAADYQFQAANAYVALGDAVREAISTFLCTVEEFNEALQEDSDVQDALVELDLTYAQKKPILQEVSWWWANLPIHVVMAHAQAGELTSPQFTECLGLVLSLGEKYAHWVRFARALDTYLRDDVEGARALFEEIADHPERDRQGDLTVTSQLLLGRILADVDPTAATEYYSRAANWGGLKGRQAKAAARVELDRLLEVQRT